MAIPDHVVFDAEPLIAETAEATLLAGGDDDYDEISDIPIERFRDGPG